MGSHTVFRTTPGSSLCGIVQTFCTHTHARTHSKPPPNKIKKQLQTSEKNYIKKIDVGGGVGVKTARKKQREKNKIKRRVGALPCFSVAKCG